MSTRRKEPRERALPSYLGVFRNRAFLISTLQGYRVYWHARETSARAKFYIRRLRFSLIQWRNAKRDSASILGSLSKRAIRAALGAAALVGALRIIEHHAISLQITSPVSNFVNTYGVLSQISGLILGLYFTAMSVVVSTVYSKVPDNIRNLIASEKVGDNYVSILMLLGAISLTELGLILQGQPASMIVLYGVLFLSLTALLTLPVLIHNVFHFFDPARLADTYIFPEFFRWADNAKCDNHGWDEPSFQYHYYKQATQSLSTYRSIVTLLVREPATNNASLTRLSALELSFLSEYVRIKGQIPTESRWYQYQIEHPKWFEADSSSAGLAMNASIPLPHKEVPNHLWVEERVATNLRRVLSHLLCSNDLEHAVALIQNLQASCTKMLRSLALKEAYFVTGICDTLIVEYISSADLTDEHKTHQLALADFYGANHVNIAIEYGKILEEISPALLKKKLHSINWNDPASVYKTHLPVAILPCLEDLLKRKQNQHMVDRSVDIPEWYNLELIAVACLQFLHAAADEVTSQYESAFTKKIDAIENKSPTLLIMQILARGLEGHHKCSSFLSMAQNLDERLHALVLVSQTAHGPLQWTDYKKRIDSVRSSIINRYGAFALAVSQEQIDKTTPDYVGHAYWLLARECFTAICEQDEERYRKCYSIYIRMMDRLWSHLSSILNSGPNTNYHISSFSEIFVDAMAIGGYAKLFNEFRRGNYWGITTEIWDAYLSACESEGKDILSACLAVAEYKSQPFFAGITNRGLERIGWEQRYNRIVAEEVGLSDDGYDYRSEEMGEKARNKVGSALIRTFGTSSIYHAENVFIYSYILHKPKMADTTPDLHTAQLIESLNITLRNDGNADPA